MCNKNFVPSDTQKLILSGKICQYCRQSTELVSAAEVYMYCTEGFVLLCRDCWAYVGVQPDNKTGLGTVADKDLRLARNKAHLEFDKLYKQGYLTKSSAYEWLSDTIKIPRQFCHIAMFSINTCEEAIELVNIKLKNLEQIHKKPTK